LKELYNNIISNNIIDKDYNKMYDILFNSIKYKNMAGVRLEVKGRLSKRYRADRALFKVK
jgi:inosine/xanthosine triphosphate pyrophosphatase family protein